MPTASGNLMEGWEIRFTASETQDIAETANAIAIICVLIPDPTLVKILAASGGLISLVARRAIRKDLALGVRVLPNPGSRTLSTAELIIRSLTPLPRPPIVPFYH